MPTERSHDKPKVELFNKYDAWNRILTDIDQENEKVRYHTFLWRDDNLGNAVGDALLRAAERGCETVAITDSKALYHLLKEFGGKGFWDTCCNTDIELLAKAMAYTLANGRNPILPTANLTQQALLKNPNFRLSRLGANEHYDHRKWIALYRQKVNWIMGMNTGSEYDGNWEDFAVRIESDDFHERLIEMHRTLEAEPFSSDKPLHPVANFTGMYREWRFPMEFNQRKIPYQLLMPDGREEVEGPNLAMRQSGRELNDVAGSLEMIETLILQARGRIRILCGYLEGNSTLSALLTAMGDGAQVEIIIPAVPNVLRFSTMINIKILMIWADELGLSDNLKIYSSPNMIHAKALQTEGGNDRHLFIGSGNPDTMSAFAYGELGVVVGSAYPRVQQDFKDNFERIRGESELFEPHPQTNIQSIRGGIERQALKMALGASVRNSFLPDSYPRLRRAMQARYQL